MRLMPDVLHAQDRIGVPPVPWLDRSAEDFDQFRRIGTAEGTVPVGQRAVEPNEAVRFETEDVAQPRVIGVARAVHVPVAGRPHVAALAAQKGPAALGRADDAVKPADRIEEAAIMSDEAHGSADAEVKRDGGAIPGAVAHDDHDRPVVAGERRDAIGERSMVVVMRHPDDRRRSIKAEQGVEPTGSQQAVLHAAEVHARRRVLESQVEARGKLIEEDADAGCGEHRIVKGAEPGGDPVWSDAEIPHHRQQRIQRRARIEVGVLAAGEALFFVVAQDSRTLAGIDLDQGDSGIVNAADADPGQVSGFAAGERGTQQLPFFRSDPAARPEEQFPPKIKIGDRQHGSRAKISPCRMSGSEPRHRSPACPPWLLFA